jgi:hypothetical protein
MFRGALPPHQPIKLSTIKSLVLREPPNVRYNAYPSSSTMSNGTYFFWFYVKYSRFTQPRTEKVKQKK